MRFHIVIFVFLVLIFLFIGCTAYWQTAPISKQLSISSSQLFSSKSFEENTEIENNDIQIEKQSKKSSIFKGFGEIKPPTKKPEGKSRSEKKEEYRKLLKLAKSQPSVHKLVGKSEDVFQSQRKQGSRGSGGV